MLKIDDSSAPKPRSAEEVQPKRYEEPAQPRFPVPERPIPSYETQPPPQPRNEAQQPLRSSFEAQPYQPLRAPNSFDDQPPRASTPRGVNQPYGTQEFTPYQPQPAYPPSQQAYPPSRSAYPPSQPSYQKPPSYPSVPSYQPQPQRRPLQRSGSPNGSGSNWMDDAFGVPSSSERYSQPTKSMVANVSRAQTTVGMSVYGTKVDLVRASVPSAHACATRCLVLSLRAFSRSCRAGQHSCRRTW